MPGSSVKWKVQDDSKSEVVPKMSRAWGTFLGQRTLLARQRKNVIQATAQIMLRVLVKSLKNIITSL